MSMSTPRSPRVPDPRRTTVRLFLRRTALAALSRVVPSAAERAGVDLFSRPLRFGAIRDPEVPGLPAHRFVIATPAGEVIAWDWGSGPTILLVHGWAGQAAQMSSFVAPLVRAGHHVLAFDHVAHGQSPGRRANVLVFEQAVRAVAARVGTVSGAIAHSLGATATAMALRRGLAADRVVLLAPPADAAPFARAFARAAGLPPARAEGVVQRVHRMIVAGAPAEPALITAAGLVLHDPEDPEVPFAHSEAITAGWPGSRVQATPGLGHRKLLRDPAVVSAVVAFITGRQRAAELAAQLTA
jgi:pimeloyl-ACP methyl ester carboxylesterase